MYLTVRAERLEDRAAVRAVNVSAFDTAAEADLVDALRDQARPIVSLVAEENGEIIGHIMFSPVTLVGRPGLHLAGLAPMAVAPARQRKGVGCALVRAGLERCKMRLKRHDYPADARTPQGSALLQSDDDFLVLFMILYFEQRAVDLRIG
jgi:predicted N-acetyltransferase YhbS